MTQDFLTATPFHLDPDAVAWVRSSFARLSAEDKLRHLFNLRIGARDEAGLAAMRAFRPGSITFGPDGTPEANRALIDSFVEIGGLPLLVSSDLEGSRMSLEGVAEWPNPIALAAIDDPDTTRKVSRMMADEAHAHGINWSFTPVLDINAAFRSAIVATRGFGSDPDTIARHAQTQLEVFQENGIAATVKHWPGEGHDDRDQHLVTTINPLSMDDWHRTHGALYKQAIAKGVLSVMSAHIALPSYAEAQGETGVEPYRPASISRHLNQSLLREALGFNGLIVSDATPMAGLGSWSKRAEHLPEIIASGCDVILFSSDPETDLCHLQAALADGRLTQARVDDAVLRQLALKAALNLHKPRTRPPTSTAAERHACAGETARRAPTLVKDTAGTLPLDPSKHRRILVFSGGIVVPFLSEPLPFALPDMLIEQGFEVTLHVPGAEIAPGDFDLVLYLFGDETLLTRGRIFLDWLGLTGHFGTAMQRLWHQIPSVMISFGYPYMLYDAPRVPTYVNAYSSTETMQRAVLDLLIGRHDWNRNSPVDPFCGLPDACY